MKIKDFIVYNKKHIRRIIAGLIMCIPMSYVMIYDESPGSVTLLKFMSILAFFPGFIMLLINVVRLFHKQTNNVYSESSVELDLARIRAVIETDSIWRR